MIKETIHKGSCIGFNNGSTLVILKGNENTRSARSSLLYCVEMKPCLMSDFLQQYGDDIDIVDDCLVGFIYIPRVFTKYEVQNEMHDYDGMNHRFAYDNSFDLIPNGDLLKNWKEIEFWTFDNNGDLRVRFNNYDDAKNWLIKNKQFKGGIEVRGYKTIRLSYDRIFLNETM